MARRLFSARTLVLGGLAVAAGAALKNRQKVVGLLGGGPSVPEPFPAPAEAPVGVRAAEHGAPTPAPAVSNVDVSGPPENTATHVPAPEAIVHDAVGGIDELAEEEAAAAEAANIGGAVPDYVAEEDFTRPADDATRPLEEAGEGYSEGQELAEADLLDNAEVAAGDPVEGERQVDEVIELQNEPLSGEFLEGSLAGSTEPLPDELPDPAPEDDEPEATIPLPLQGVPPAPAETSAEEKSANVWKRPEPSIADQPTVEQPRVDRLDDGA